MENILERINKATLNFLAPLTLEETYDIVVREAVKLVDAKYGSLILDKQGKFVRAFSTIPIAQHIELRKRGFTYQAFKENKAFVVHLEDIQKFHPEVTELGVKSNIFIPLAYRSKPIGVLIVNSGKEATFSSKEFNVLKLFGSMVTLAIRKTELHDETKKALEARDLFLSMATHELRTPLTTISGYVQLLKDRMTDHTTESAWVEELSKETARLTRLVSDLLEVSRARVGKLKYSWQVCSLREIVEQAVADFRLTIPERGIKLENLLSSTADLVVADHDRLLQVILNILDNAVKYSCPQTGILVVLDYKRPYLRVNISDKGMGISKKNLSKVFEAFYKGDYNEDKGMGLGLYLAKEIMERHHGRIHIHSKLNTGTTVEINLPKARS